MIDYRTILKAGVPDTDYHADHGTLSASGARSILACPARFKWERDNGGRPVKRQYEVGHLAHKLILGEGAEIVVVEAENWLTKAAKAERDEARAAGKVPVLRHEHDAALVMRDAVKAHETAGALFADGVPELSGYWRDRDSGVGLRFRPDWLTTIGGRPVCVDLKTAASADPAEFARSAAKLAYHQQAAWYLDGLTAHGITGAAFYFVAVEKAAPFPVSVIELDDEAMNEGRRMNRRAIDTYVQCMETGVWPGYSDGVVSISLPPWALSEMEITV